MLGSCLLSRPSGRAEDLGGGVEVWFGHFQSLRLGWQPFLNVDATQRAFFKSGKVHELMAEMFRSNVGQPLNDRDYYDFGKKIATLKVKLVPKLSAACDIITIIHLGFVQPWPVRRHMRLQWIEQVGGK